MSFFDELRPASYRGLPFVVLGGQLRVGRRQSNHEYPNRDTVWVEDLGRQTRRFELYGFLVGDDVIAQRDRFMAAAESPENGQLVHPTLGTLKVSLAQFDSSENWERGRMFDLHMVFVEDGSRVFPIAQVSTTQAVAASATATDASAALAYVQGVDQALRRGAAVIRQAQLQAAAYVRQAQKYVDDATSLYNSVSDLPGEFGRYFGGRTRGGLTVLGVQITSSPGVSGLIAQGAQRRQAAQAAGTAMQTAAAAQSPNVAGAYATSVQALLAAVLASAADPADALRILLALAQSATPDSGGTGPIGSAIATLQAAAGDLFRRAAVTALARAASGYHPSSYDDAAAVRSLVVTQIDAEALLAADQSEDSVYAALRDLRTQVAQDLEVRGANLAPVATFSLAASRPSVVLALSLYRDVTRADALVTQVNPRHPLFMPQQFRALAK